MINELRMPSNSMKIGHGYDVHQLVSDRKLIIGGVTIPYDKGLLGHSDADVLLHAICDAILGALGLGDIGKHFPDSDAQYAGIDSRTLLRAVAKQMTNEEYAVANVDATIVAQAPKMSPYLKDMKNHIAADLVCDSADINIKATTTEGLGFVGRGEGIEAHAVVILQGDQS